MSTIFDNTNNKIKCQKFTPAYLAETMLDIVGYTRRVHGKKILENSFGSGNILSIVVRRYIEDSIDAGLTPEVISDNLSKDIYGIELDKDLYIQCMGRLDRIASEYNIPSVHWSLFNENALTWDTTLCFDYIVGNPPYINYKDIDEDSKKYLKKNFSSCSSGKFDYCYAFIERALSLLSPSGKLVQLVPANIYKNVFGENLRNLLKPHICVINEYPEQTLFDDTLTSSTIFMYDKTCTSLGIKYNNLTTGYSTNIPRQLLTGKWVFQDPTISKKNTLRFGDCFHASIVVATLLNQAFILKKEELDKKAIEKAIVRKAAAPRQLRKKVEEYIVFPYYYSENGLAHYTEEAFTQRFPNAARHLNDSRQDLDSRDNDKNAQWFEYGRSQALAHLNQPKLLLSTVITNSVEAYLLDADTVPYSGIFITVKNEAYTLEDAKHILQSPDFLSYVKSLGISVSGKSKRITCKDINNYKFVKE